MRTAEAAVLGLLQGPAELLPISSSAHAALIGADVDQAMAVALHAGTGLAMLDLATRSPAVLIPAGVMSVAAALALGEAAERRLSSAPSIAAGLGLGAAGMVLADRIGREWRAASNDAGWVDGLALGAAQAAALWPGVSRSGATIAAARARGYERGAAVRLSFGVGVPTMLGAAALKARQARVRREHAVAAAAAFASTLAARPLLAHAGAVWPFAVYRAGVALALLRRSRT